MDKSDVICRVIKRILLLQEFDITILDKPGKHNVVEYLFSKLNHVVDKEMVYNAFPDEHLFSISTHTPCFSDKGNYLATRSFPPRFTYKV